RQDVFYAFRQFRRTPAVGTVAIGSITLGIAATVIVFTFLDALVLHPLPYEGADRMVTVSQTTKTGQGRGGVPLSGDEFAVFQELGVFDGAVASAGWDMTLTGGELPERVFSGQFSGDAFRYFGLPPTIGRLLTAADAPVSGEPPTVVVLSY